MEKNSIIQENRILEVIKVNNTNLVGSIVKNLNFYACAGKLNEAMVVNAIVNDCNPVINQAMVKNNDNINNMD